MGLMWGLFSVMIASAAQLSLGYAASHLPSMTRWRDFIAAFFGFYNGAQIVVVGLLGFLICVFWLY